MRFWFGRALLIVSVTTIAFATLVPMAAQGIGQVDSPLCMTCSSKWLSDAISNVALFVPLGIAIVLCGVRGGWTVAIGASISVAIEVLQFVGWPAERTASVSDFLANSTGTAIGVLVIFARPWWRHPSRVVAQRIAWLWTVATVASLTGVTWAMAPDERSVGARAPIASSRMDHTPGYGWFGGVTEHASFNGVAITHAGTGPLMLQMPRTDTVTIVTHSRGRDDGAVFVPIVWIYATRDTQPHSIVLERDRDVAVRARLRAARVGLYTPTLVLRDIFPSARHDSTTVSAIHASITSGHITLTGSSLPDSTRVQYASLALGATVGWAIVQSVVEVSASYAGLCSALWLLLWFAPVGRVLPRALASNANASFERYSGEKIGVVACAAAAWALGVLAVLWWIADVWDVTPIGGWWAALAVGGTVLTSVTTALVDAARET